MPFNLICGMNAIFPIEFLIPTLQVARHLEWIGPEVSQRIDDLEKLDETRLMVVGHMYAQKRQQKQHHDLVLKPKELRKRDLILVYTLKPHVGKFKKRGFGECVVEEISLSGAVKISTLNGESMPNWISGYQIKKYELPLTNDMLEPMHAAKNKKKAARFQKEEA